MEDADPPSDSVKQAQYDKDFYELKLYVVSHNKKSLLAIRNLKEICYKFLAGKCEIEVINLTENPRLARLDQIVAIPTLIRKNHPGRVIGDLSDQERVLKILNLHISKVTDDMSGRSPVEENFLEDSEARIRKDKRSKNNDLQPYIGSDLHSSKPKAWMNRHFFVL